MEVIPLVDHQLADLLAVIAGAFAFTGTLVLSLMFRQRQWPWYLPVVGVLAAMGAAYVLADVQTAVVLDAARVTVVSTRSAPVTLRRGDVVALEEAPAPAPDGWRKLRLTLRGGNRYEIRALPLPLRARVAEGVAGRLGLAPAPEQAGGLPGFRRWLYEGAEGKARRQTARGPFHYPYASMSRCPWFPAYDKINKLNQGGGDFQWR